MKKKVQAAVLAIAIVFAGVVADGGQADALTRNRCRQYEQTAREVGWSAKEAVIISRVMWRESRCQADAYNGRRRDRSYGLTQVNTWGYLWKGVLAECGGKGGKVRVKADLFNPRTNLWCAKQLRDRYGWYMTWGVRA